MYTKKLQRFVLSILISLCFGIGFAEGSISMSGTYTISAAGTGEYTYIRDAVSDLVQYGISGPVIFSIEPGEYNEQISIPAISGASYTRTITFQSATGNSDDVTITYDTNSSSRNYTLRLNGAVFCYFKNLCLKATDYSYSRVIEIFDQSDNNTFEGNRIIGMANNSTSPNYALVYSANGVDSGNVFQANIFENGSYGLYMSGPNTSSIENQNQIVKNHFINQYYRGIYCGYQNSVQIRSNVISSEFSCYGILLSYCYNENIILNNSIILSNGSGGILLSRVYGESDHHGLIANNFISIDGSNAPPGIQLTYCNFQNIYHNSINILTTNTSSKCFYDYNSTDCQAFNNIFSNFGGGYAFYINSNTNLVSDYNNLFTEGSNIAYRGGTSAQDLIDWQEISEQDYHSLSIAPSYISYTDLHITETQFYGKGYPPASVPDDIDGDFRNPSAPDIGADEIFPYENDLALVEWTGISGSFMSLSNTLAIKVNITNKGTLDVSNISISMNINGDIHNETIPETLPPGESLNYVFSETADISQPGHYSCSVSLHTDDFDENNRIHKSFYAWDSYTPPSLSCGLKHTALLNASGDLWAWGDNSWGQIGDNTTTDKEFPVLVNQNIIRVSSGSYHTLVLRADGTVWAWGLNSHGQLGDGTTSSKYYPVQVYGLMNIIVIAAGSNHSMALDQDGHVWTWGYNASGQLGDGSTTNKTTPVQVKNLEDIIAISAGYHHCLALKNDKTVWAWGDNGYRQLCNGTTADQPLPISVNNLTNVIAISCSYKHNLAIKDDNSVWAWGYNGDGRLGDGTYTTPTIEPVKTLLPDDIVAVDCGQDHSIALQSNGNVWTWGKNDAGQLGDGTTVSKPNPAIVEHIQSEIIAVSGGEQHSVALTSNGTIWAWGKNDQYQLGNKTNQDSLIPIKASANQSDMISMHLSIPEFALETDGRLSQLGKFSVDHVSASDRIFYLASSQPSEITVPESIIVPAFQTTTFFELVVQDDTDIDGAQHVLITVSDDMYQLSESLSILDDETALITVNLPAAITENDCLVSQSAMVTLDKTANKDITVYLSTSDSSLLTVLSTVIIHEGETSAYFDLFPIDDTVIDGQKTVMISASIPGWLSATQSLVIEDNENRQIYLSIPQTAIEGDFIDNRCKISISGTYAETISISLVSDITVVTLPPAVTINAGWTYVNFDMTISDNTSINPIQDIVIYAMANDWLTDDKVISIYDDEVIDVAPDVSGGIHTLALNDSGEILVCGYNGNGELGHYTSDTRINRPFLLNEINNVIAIETGYNHSIAIRLDHSVWAWGYNRSGQLGIGSNSSQRNPVPVMDDVKSISGGSSHTLSLKLDRSVWSFGNNSYGQLGINNNESSNIPVKIETLNDIVEISCGAYHSLALKNDGSVWSWGYNSQGQLGNASKTNSSVPIEITALNHDVKLVAAGESHSIAIKNNGTVWSWGYNVYGQLGDGTNISQSLPVPVTNLNDVIDIKAGDSHNLALRSDGTVWSWGSNYHGQLGNGSTTNSSIPQQITRLNNIVAISCGINHSYAIKADGSVFSWGYNNYGQLGNETFTDQSIPAHVKGPVNIESLNLISLAISLPESLTEGIGSIENSGTISIERPRSKNTLIFLSSNDTSEISVPSSITLAAGYTSVNFTITVEDDSLLDGSQKIEISALNQKYTARQTMTVSDNETAELTLNIPESATENDHMLSGSITVSQVVGDDLTIDLFSSNPTELTVTSSVTIQAGADTAFFNIFIIDDNEIDSTTSTSITATVAGWTSASESIRISDNENRNISLIIPDTLIEGSQDIANTGKIVLSGFYASDITINLFAEDPTELSAASTVIIPAGQTEIVFDLIIPEDGLFDGNQSASITASSDDSWVSDTRHVTVFDADGVHVSPGITAGSDHSLAWDDAGNVWGWGNNYYGTVGDHTNSNQARAVLLSNINNIISVDGGYQHTLGLRVDGSVWSWGYNYYGQLGNGTTDNKNYPIRVNKLNNVIAVAAGAYHSLALMGDGSVWAWGRNNYGQLGIESTTDQHEPIQVEGVSNIIAIACGNHHSVALKANGTVWTWGYNHYGQLGDGNNTDRNIPSQISTIDDIQSIVCGAHHSLALNNEGNLWAWGANSNGQLGDGTKTNRNTPVIVSDLNNIQTIACGDYHSMAVKSDGILYAWGDNGYYQLGNGTSTDEYKPIEIVKLKDVKAIAAGQYHSFAMQEDGTVHSWGYNNSYQLGDGSRYNRSLPVDVITTQNTPLDLVSLTIQIPETAEESCGITQGTVSFDHSLAKPLVIQLESSNSFEISVPSAITIGAGLSSANFDFLVVDDTRLDGTQIITLNATYDQYVASDTIIVNDNDSATLIVEIPSDLAEGDGLITEGGLVSVASPVDSDVEVSLKTNDSSELMIPETITILSGQNSAVFYINVIDDQELDNSQTVSITATVTGWSSGTADVTIHDNETHELGVILPAQSYEGYTIIADSGSVVISGTLETELTVNLISNNPDIIHVPSSVSIAAGMTSVYFDIIIIDDSIVENLQTASVSAYLTNWVSAIGIITIIDNENIPTIPLISAGSAHTLALKNNGSLWAWGYNGSGQLGDGTNDHQSSPLNINFTNCINISAGSSHSLIVRSDGTVWGWGYNAYGQTGTTSSSTQLFPVISKNINNAIQASAGSGFSLVLKADGTVWAWGVNNRGQLGDDEYVNRTFPLPVLNIEHCIAIFAAMEHSLAIASDGSVWSWGYNDKGQLGIGSTSYKRVPVKLNDLDHVIAISAGDKHSIALREDGTVWTWGSNEYCQLGNGSSCNQYSKKYLPTLVPGLNDIIAISAGYYHSLALTSDGTVMAWGRNDYGELGNGTSENQATPVQVPGLSNIIAIDAGTYYSTALKADGTIYSFGKNNYGQLGDKTLTHRNDPVNVLSSDGIFSLISLSLITPQMTDESDGISGGQGIIRISDPEQTDITIHLVTSDISEITIPAQITIPAGQLSAAFDITVLDDSILDGDQIVTITAGYQGYSVSDQIIVHDNDLATITIQIPEETNESAGILQGTVSLSGMAGSTVTVQLFTDHPDAIDIPDRVTINTNENFSTFDINIIDNALISDAQFVNLTASVSGWISGTDTIKIVDNESRQLSLLLPAQSVEGYGTLDDAGKVSMEGTFDTNLTVYLSVQGGSKISIPSSIVILQGRTSAIFDLTILDNTLIDGASTLTITATAIDMITGIYHMTILDNDDQGFVPLIAAGLEHSLALSDEGHVWSWGYNEYGQVGDGTTIDRTNPIVIDGLNNIIAIAAGGYHSLALERNGKVWAWGKNHYGQLGNGTTVDKDVPVQVSLLDNVIAIACGYDHSVALKADGSILTWGANTNKQLGDVRSNYKTTPVHLNLDETVTHIACGYYHNLAVSSDGTVWSWGYNNYGQLGNNTTDNASIPIPVLNGQSIIAIAGGHYHSLALSSEGTIWAWGRNNYGQLGDQTWTTRLIPVELSQLSHITGIAAGVYHSMAVQSGGALWTWGYNGSGQLGTGTQSNSNTPILNSFLDNITDISAGLRHSLTIGWDGSVHAWGSNQYGQTGQSSGDSSYIPIEVSDTEPLDLISLAVSIEIPQQKSEADGFVSGTILLSEAPAADLRIELSNDHPTDISCPDAVTILMGESSAAFSITIIDDNRLDGTQNVKISVSAEGYGMGSAIMSVLDNESASLTIQILDHFTEGMGTIQAGLIVSSRMVDSNIDISLLSEDVTELKVPSVVTIPKGLTSVVFDISIVDDHFIDGSVPVTMTAQVPGWISGIGTTTIMDNDPGKFCFNAKSYQIGEENGSIVITIIRTESTSEIISVDYTTQDQSATVLDGDYMAVSGTLTFGDGQASQTFIVPVLNDERVEGNETIGLLLRNPMNHASLAEPYAATLTIIDDDREILNPPVITQVTPGNGKVALAWIPVDNPDILKHYAVYVSDSNFSTVEGMTPKMIVTHSSVTLTGLLNDSVIYIAVTAVNVTDDEIKIVETVSAMPETDQHGPIISDIRLNNMALSESICLSSQIGYFTLTAADESGIGYVDFLTDGKPYHTDRNGSQSYSCKWDISDIDDGPHQFDIHAYDTLGNLTIKGFTITVCLSPPPAPVILEPLNDHDVNTPDIHITGQSLKQTQVMVYQNQIASENWISVDETGLFDIPLQLTEGLNICYIVAKNRAGTSMESNAITITLDTSIPESPSLFTGTSKSSGTMHFSWIAPQGTSIKGFNIYCTDHSFSSQSEAITINDSLITDLDYDFIPDTDGLYYCRITAISTTDNTSKLSREIRLTSDRTPPEATSIVYTPEGEYDPVSGRMSHGLVNVLLTVSEPLESIPFLSLNPIGIQPIVVQLIKQSDITYSGLFVISETIPSQTAYAVFSARDLAGNRGVDIVSGSSIQIDTEGPSIQQIKIQPEIPIPNNADQPVNITATIGLDDAVMPNTFPQLSYVLSNEGREPIEIENLTLITDSSENAETWQASFVLPSDAGLLNPEQLQFIFSAYDDLNNQSHSILCENSFEVYQGNLPALSSPTKITGMALPDGYVVIYWQSEENTLVFQIYRQAPGESELTPWILINNAFEFTEQTTIDGTYRYAVATVRQANDQTSTSAMSEIIEIVSDSEPPASPENFSLTLTSLGIAANWTHSSSESLLTYRLYRTDQTEMVSIDGLTPTQTGISDTHTIDSMPSSTQHCYVATAVDSAGNESLPSSSFYLNFELLPVSRLIVRQKDNHFPEIFWDYDQGSTIGCYVYQDDRLLRDSVIESFSYTDTGYTNDQRTYTLITVDQNQHQGLPRSITLPKLSMEIQAGESISRGVMNRLIYLIDNPTSYTALSAHIALTIEGQKHISESFAIESYATINVPVRVGGYASLPDVAQLTSTLMIVPNKGEQIEIVRTSSIEVHDEMLIANILNQPLIRGTHAKISFSLENAGEEEIDIVSATNKGMNVSSDVRVELLDADENVLSTSAFFQNLGNHIITLAEGTSVARIQSGKVFSSSAFDMAVPSGAPDEMTIRLTISSIYYRYATTEQVCMEGLQTSRAVSIIDTAYTGTVLTVSPEISDGSQGILISGEARNRRSDYLMPNVPLKLVISGNGFERKTTVYTDESGLFAYTFTAMTNESGNYMVWAVHPDLNDKPVQSSFVIQPPDLSIDHILADNDQIINIGDSDSFNLNIPKNYPQKISIPVTAGIQSLTNVSIVYDPLNQPQGELAEGVHIELCPPVEMISAGQTSQLTFTIWADNTADESGKIILTIQSNDADQQEKIIINTVFTQAKPSLEFSPTYLETGLSRDTVNTESIIIQNKGLEALYDMTANLLQTDETPAPDWVVLNKIAQSDRIDMGEKRSINITFKPTSGVAEGDYLFVLRIDGDNYPTTDIQIIAHVTQSGKGNVLFKVSDIYTGTIEKETGNIIQGLSGASLYIQNQEVQSIEQKLQTDHLGEALIENLPAGRYQYRVTADNHQETTGRLWIKPGLTTSEDVFLKSRLVTYEFDVKEITLEDRYEIILEAVYETDVPAAVVVAEPSSIDLPKMEVGDVYYGEFSLTNYGLIKATDFTYELPENQNYKYELLSNLPETLLPKQRIIVPYRVTCLNNVDQIDAGGGDSEDYYWICIFMDYLMRCTNGKEYWNHSYHCFHLYEESDEEIYVPTNPKPKPRPGNDYKPGGGSNSDDDPDGPYDGGTPVITDKPDKIEGVDCYPQEVRMVVRCDERLKNITLNDQSVETGCTVNCFLREYHDQALDLLVKVPGGHIDVKRYFYNNQWHWSFDHNQLHFINDYSGENIEKIERAGVIYQKVSENLFTNETYKIIRTEEGFLWKNKLGQFENYTLDGRISSYGDLQHGIILKYLYNEETSLIIGMTDKNDQQLIWLEYNDQLQVSALYDVRNRRVEYIYIDAQLTEVTDVLGNHTTYVYDDLNRIIKSIDAANRSTFVSYDAMGNITSVLDASGKGHFFKFSYDETREEHYAQIKTSSGQIKEVWYDENGYTTKTAINGRTVNQYLKTTYDLIVYDEKGKSTRIQYDEAGNKTQIVQPDNTSIHFEYDLRFNKISKKIDENGIITLFEYDEKGNLLQTTEAADTPSERITTYMYDNESRLISKTIEGDINTAPSTISYQYDNNGNVSSITGPEGHMIEFLDYDNIGNYTTLIDARGYTWTFQYDLSGQLIQLTNPLGYTTCYQYDGVGNMTSSINTDFIQNEFEYDAHNNLIKIYDAYHNQIVQEYNSDNLMIQKIDQEGVAAISKYDNEGRLLSTIDASGNKSTYHYDESSQFLVSSSKPVRINFPAYNRQIYYDQNERIIKEVDILNETTNISRKYEYDDAGNVLSKTDEEGHTTHYEYDALKRLIAVTNPLNETIQRFYDDRDNLIKRIDPDGSMTQYEYNKNNQLIRFIRPMGQETRYEYDNQGNLTHLYSPDNHKTILSYDALNRCTRTEYFMNSEDETPYKTISFEYDRNGNLISYDDGITSAIYEYDKSGNKTKETVDYKNFVLSYAYSYYANGLKKTYTSPDSTTYTYTYENNQLSSINIPDYGQITFNEYQWRHPLKKTLPGRTIHRYQYDSLMRPILFNSEDSGSNTLLEQQYDYSPAGLISQILTQSDRYRFQYDSLHRITMSSQADAYTHLYEYDDTNNRISASGRSYQYNSNNELTQNENISYQYDSNGNVTHMIHETNSTQYFYANENQMLSVQHSNGDTIHYYYDPFGRRLWKEVEGVRTCYFYSEEGLTGEYDTNGNEIKTYGYQPDSQWSSAPIFQKIDDEYYWYHNDHQGKPLMITDSSGKVVWKAAFDVFGNVTIQNNLIENNIRFPGQYYDSETGLHYNWHRYYDPSTGRYLSPDPERNGINAYVYSNNNSLFFTDSQGLCVESAGKNVADYITGLDSVTGSDWVNLIEGFKNFDFEKIFDGSTNIASSFINNSTLSNSLSVVGAIKTIQENTRKGSKYIYDRNRRMIMSSATYNKQGGYYEIDPTILQAYPTRDFAYKNWQSNYRNGEETDFSSESIYKFFRGNPNVTEGTLSEYGYMIKYCQF
jgi:RHS repeat-associated protein